MKCTQAPHAEGCDSGNQEPHQPFPARSTELGKNMNLGLARLKKRLTNENGKVYAYVLTTVALTTDGKRKEKLKHVGSGPNFQGGVITLCTCKHFMRTWRDCADWKNTWIAGVTGKENGNLLFYLVKVEEAYESHFELWDARQELRKAYGIKLEAKAAHLNFLGDVFIPKKRGGLKGNARFIPGNYHGPCPKGHSHSQKLSPKQWHNDIRQPTAGRIAKLLVGNPSLSFLWAKPVLKFVKAPSRGTKRYDTIQEFLRHLHKLKVQTGGSD